MHRNVRLKPFRWITMIIERFIDGHGFVDFYYVSNRKHAYLTWYRSFCVIWSGSESRENNFGSSFCLRILEINTITKIVFLNQRFRWTFVRLEFCVGSLHNRRWSRLENCSVELVNPAHSFCNVQVCRIVFYCKLRPSHREYE